MSKEKRGEIEILFATLRAVADPRNDGRWTRIREACNFNHTTFPDYAGRLVNEGLIEIRTEKLRSGQTLAQWQITPKGVEIMLDIEKLSNKIPLFLRLEYSAEMTFE